MIADPADMTEPTHGLGAILEQSLFESGIGPGLGHNLRAVVRADFRFIGLDDGIERGRLDVAFLGQDRLECAYATFGLRQVGMVVIVVAHVREDSPNIAAMSRY